MKNKENAVRKSADRGHGITTDGLLTPSKVLAEYGEAEAQGAKTRRRKRGWQSEPRNEQTRRLRSKRKNSGGWKGAGNGDEEEAYPAAVA